VAIQFQIRRGTTAQWQAATPSGGTALMGPILAQGEMGYDTTTKTMYIGDGATQILLLPSVTSSGVFPSQASVAVGSALVTTDTSGGRQWAAILTYPSGGSTNQVLTKTGTGTSGWSSVVNSLTFSNSTTATTGAVTGVYQAPAMIRRISDRTLASTLVNCFDVSGTDVGFTLEASTLYRFTARYLLTRVSGTNNIQIGFPVPTGSNISWNAGWGNNNGSAMSVFSYTTYASTTVPSGTTPTSSVTISNASVTLFIVSVEGFLTTPASLGAITKLFPQAGTSTGASVTLGIGSTFTIEKIGPATTAEVLNGSWT